MDRHAHTHTHTQRDRNRHTLREADNHTEKDTYTQRQTNGQKLTLTYSCSHTDSTLEDHINTTNPNSTPHVVVCVLSRGR